MDLDHLENFVSHGKKIISKNGLELGDWLGSGGMGAVYALKKFPDERVVKFTMDGGEAAFGWWIMNLRARERTMQGFRGVGKPPVVRGALPSFLPVVHSVRIFAAGELSDLQSEPIWAVEREDLPASIYTQLVNRRDVMPQNGFMEKVADKAYELTTDEFRIWLSDAIAVRPKVVSRRERKVWLALGEAMTRLAANGVGLSDVDLDNWAARYPGGEPVLRDLGFSSTPSDAFFHAEPHKGGVQRDTIREDSYEDEEYGE